MSDPRKNCGIFSRIRKGQSLVEVALLLPILLIILSGTLEFGFVFTNYLAALDATRNAARFSSDNQFDINDADLNCATTTDFYRATACLVLTELAAEQPTISLCMPNYMASRHCPRAYDQYDDIIVSVFSILRDDAHAMQLVRFPAGVSEGWSFDADMIGEPQTSPRSGKHATRFTNAEVLAMLDPAAPSTGIVVVELNYSYWQMLALPWFTAFVPDPIEMHLYAWWPLVSAEPTPTPRP